MAFWRDGFLGTDDSSLVERIGVDVKPVEGSYTNIKITNRGDLLFAEFLLRNKKIVSSRNWVRRS